MEKTPGDIIILHKCIKNHDHMLHSFWDIMYIGCFFFQFGLFFALLHPQTPFLLPAPANDPKNQKFLKIWKKPPWDIIIWHMCTKNNDHVMYGSWDMVWTDSWTDGRTDGRKKWHIEVGAPTNSNRNCDKFLTWKWNNQNLDSFKISEPRPFSIQ